MKKEIPHSNKQLCICQNKLAAYSVKNSIQRILSIHINIEKTSKNNFAIIVSDSNYKKAYMALINDNNTMTNINPIINNYKDTKKNEAGTVKKLIPISIENIA